MPEQCLSCHLFFPPSSYSLFLKAGWTQQVSGPQKLGVRMVSPSSPASFPYPCPLDHSPQPSLIVFQILVVLSYFRFSFLLTFLTFECLSISSSVTTQSCIFWSTTLKIHIYLFLPHLTKKNGRLNFSIGYKANIFMNKYKLEII